jgi:hypothetical protein
VVLGLTLTGFKSGTGWVLVALGLAWYLGQAGRAKWRDRETAAERRERIDRDFDVVLREAHELRDEIRRNEFDLDIPDEQIDTWADTAKVVVEEHAPHRVGWFLYDSGGWAYDEQRAGNEFARGRGVAYMVELPRLQVERLDRYVERLREIRRELGRSA